MRVEVVLLGPDPAEAVVIVWSSTRGVQRPVIDESPWHSSQLQQEQQVS